MFIHRKFAKELKKEDCKHNNRHVNNSVILNNPKKWEKNDEDDILKILWGKGIFPYESMNSYYKLIYNKTLKKGRLL